jgi:glycosyltransferase involved in cell wall biosynthesis
LRILFLLHRFPYPPMAGGPWQALNLIGRLSRSHEIDILAFEHEGDGADVEALSRMCPNVRVLGLFPLRRFSRGLREALKRLLPRLWRDVGRAVWLFWRFRVSESFGRWPYPEYWRADFARAVSKATASGGYDVVHIETIMMARYRAFCGDLTTVASAYDALASWMENWTAPEGGMARAAWRTCRSSAHAHERRAFAKFQSVCVVTPLERRRLLAIGPALDVEAIPLSVHDLFFSGEPAPADGTREVRTLFFPASWTLADQRCADALLRFLRDGLPQLRRRHNVRACISHAPGTRDVLRTVAGLAGVTLVGWVPDFRQALCDSDVVVFMDAVDCGTKNRVVQAMAAARPVVATPAAAAGVGASEGMHLCVRDSPDGFVAAIDHLLGDPVAAQRMGDSARAFAREHFSADTVAIRWESAYGRARQKRAS